MVEYIIKRDRSLAPWDRSLIVSAVQQAFTASKAYCNGTANSIAQNVEDEINKTEIKKVGIELVQDLVQTALTEAGHHEVATRYSEYRRRRAQARERLAIVNKNRDLIDSYMERNDWRVHENANMDYSYQGLLLHLMGEQQSLYALNDIPEEIAEAHQKGFFHIHDLSMGLTGYCAGWSLCDLLLEGFNCPGKDGASGPAKRFDTALGQMNNFMGVLQNEWAGAQAFNNVDTYLAPLLWADRQEYDEEMKHPTDEHFYKKVVKQGMQKFIHNINTPSRWGGQTPFTNLTFDLTCPAHLEDEPAIIGGKYVDMAYGDFEKEMQMINRAYLEVMIEGDSYEKMFPFPIPTYNVTSEFPWDSTVGKLILELTAKYGVPYFQNFINSDLKPEDVRSMCCRLQMDLRELRTKTGGLFGAGDLTGSIGVVTLNLPKLAYIAETEEEFLQLVEMYARMAKTYLELKRKMLDRNLDAGLYPWTKRYLKQGYKGHFSTIGLNGGHEACLNLLKVGIEDLDGVRLMRSTLERLRVLVREFQEETGHLFNLEATPAEGTGYRLARLDQEAFPDIIQSGSNGTPYYTNSTALPVGSTENVMKALVHQDLLQPLYSGGTVFHTLLGESVADPDAIKSFLVKTFSLTKLPYVSITPTYSNCEDHGHIAGEHWTCPKCGKETEVFTRIVGYYRPVKRWNKGKQAEYKNRVVFSELR